MYKKIQLMHSMEQMTDRYCPVCATITKPSLLHDNNYVCPTCNTSFLINGSFLLDHDHKTSSNFIDRAILIQQGQATPIGTGNKVKRTYTRFRTEKTEHIIENESNATQIISEGFQIWSDSIIPVGIGIIIFGLLLFLLGSYIPTEILNGNEMVSQALGINLTPNWIGETNFLFAVIPILIVPILNPVQWLYYIVLTLGLGLTILFLHRQIYSTPSDPILFPSILIKYMQKVPQLVILGGIIAITNLLFLENGKLLLASFSFDQVLPNVTDIEGLLQTEGFAIVAWAIAAVILFPIWLLTQIILFLAIPSIVLARGESWLGIGHSEVLVRGRFLKIFKFYVARALLALIPIIVLQSIEISIFSDLPSGLITIPLVYLSLTIMAAWQVIMYEEESRRLQSSREMRQYDI